MNNGTSNTPLNLRIFLSSPGDVPGERKQAITYIKQELAYLPSLRGKITCEVVAWDDPYAHIPMLADETPQESINNARPRPAVCDIVIVILWSRMGTPLPGEITKPDGSRYQSGTEWEYLDAAHSESTTKPRVVVYRKTVEPSIGLMDPDVEGKRDQFMKVQEFFKQFKNADGSLKGGVNEYKTIEEFIQLLKQHLPELISRRLSEEPQEVRGNGVETDKGEHATQLGDPIRQRYLKALRRDCLRIPLSVLGEDPNAVRAVTLDQVFVSLRVTQKSAEQLRKHDHWTHEEELEPVQALEAMQACKEVVLLGDPGSGKSSLVRHILADLAKSELEDTAPLFSGTEGLLPVFILLRELAPRLAEEVLPPNHDKRRERLAALVVEQVKAYAEAVNAAEYAAGIERVFTDENVFLVLDGLDEVAYELRILVREAVRAVLDQYNLLRVIITCRIRSYTGDSVFDGVSTFTLAKLDEELIASFVDNWYKAQCELGRVNESEQRERSIDLKTVATKAPLLSLASNPMLLTTMTIIHQQETVLPKERVKLYDKAVDLLLKRWQLGKGEAAKELATYIESHDKKMRPIMERLAFEAHTAGAGDEAADLQRMESIELLSDAQYLGHEGLASQFLDYVDERAGLLIGRGGTPQRPRVYSFPHRQFQEYLAGCYIVGAPRASRRLRKLAKEGDFWTEAVVLGIEEQVYNSGSYGPYTVLNLASQLSQLLTPASSEAEERLVLWMSKVPEVIGASEVAGDPGDVEPGGVLLERLQGQLVRLLGGTLPPIERAEAGRTLAKIGDPRVEKLTLKDMAFCYVPQGPFEMGSTDYDNEKPEATFEIAYTYWIGQSPVTQAQYTPFVEAGAYENKQWWTDAGWAYIQKQERRSREEYGYPFELANHPVVGVTWYEAHAYCKWLTAYAHEKQWLSPGFRLVLPNEPEWEKAARGGLEIPQRPIGARLSRLRLPGSIGVRENENAKRRYPWGDEVTSNHCNYYSNIGTTSSSGSYKEGGGIYGTHDQSGNVYEWTRSIYQDYPYESGDGRENEQGEERRVVRGGSFVLGTDFVRCAYRYRGNPSHHFFSVGFRLVALPPRD